MKKLLWSKLVLKIFHSEHSIEIYTDASIKGIGAVLKQEDKDGRK